MAHEVFVSYSTNDKPIADAVCATLERHGVRCWIAPRDILPGLDWGAAIIDAIGESRVMVLVFSASANKSPQIKREVERAVHKGVTIIPVRIEDVPLGKTLEYFISSSHWLDAFTPSVEAHLGRLAETVRLILARPSRAVPGTGPVPAIATSAAAPAAAIAPLLPSAPPPPPRLEPLAVPRPAPPRPRPASPPFSGAVRVIAAGAAVLALVLYLATRGHSPRIDSIQFPPTMIQGQRANGVIHFSDKKGDAAFVRFDVVEGTAFQPWTMELTGTAGQTSGTYGFWLSSPVPGHVVLSATLIDGEGKKSRPTRFAFDVEPAGRASAPHKKSIEIQVPGGMRFKVN